MAKVRAVAATPRTSAGTNGARRAVKTTIRWFPSANVSPTSASVGQMDATPARRRSSK
jgi:hypothetical protein